MAHGEQSSDSPPFPDSSVSRAREAIAFALGLQSPLAVLQPEDQPFFVNLLSAVAHVCGDVDRGLPDLLAEGVSTGCLQPIPYSGAFFPAEPGISFDSSAPFSECEGNWSKAEDNPDTTHELIQEDIKQGFVFQVEGGEEAAKRQWPNAVAMGKLNLAIAEGKSPRLVLDSSVPGVNSRVELYERVEHPSLLTLKQSLRAPEVCQTALASA